MKKCTECIHSRLIISENGYHAICTLPESYAIDCLTHGRAKFEGNPLYLKCEGILTAIRKEEEE